MDDPLYREIILDHWKNPHNAGVIDGADIDVREFNPLCGDDIRLTVKVGNGNIEAIKFSGQGCAISQASASILTDSILGKSIEEVKTLKAEDHLAELGIELTPARLKCALLSYSTLQRGIS